MVRVDDKRLRNVLFPRRLRHWAGRVVLVWPCESERNRQKAREEWPAVREQNRKMKFYLCTKSNTYPIDTIIRLRMSFSTVLSKNMYALFEIFNFLPAFLLRTRQCFSKPGLGNGHKTFTFALATFSAPVRRTLKSPHRAPCTYGA